MTISAITLAVLGLASYRITRLVVEDTIAEPVRHRLVVALLRRSTALRRSLVTLITCAFCAGWWISGLVLFAYTATIGEWATPVIYGLTWFAVAGVAALLNAADTALLGGDAS